MSCAADIWRNVKKMTFSDVDIQFVMKQILHCEDFVVTKHELRVLSGDAIGFTSVNAELKVWVACKGEVLERCLFAKLTPVNDERSKQLIQERRISFKEKSMYKELLPILGKYIKDKIHPECYLARDDAILMENLAGLGYKTVIKEFYNLNQCEAALSALAKLHGASICYVMLENADAFKTHGHILFEAIFKDGNTPEGCRLLRSLYDATERLVKTFFPSTSEEVLQRLLKLTLEIPSFVKPSQDELNIISHGDLWSNNIMFKYDQQDKITSCLLIDYQLVRFCPPAVDVLMLIHLNTQKELREHKEKGINYLLDFYFKNLTACVEQNGVKIDSYFCWEDFKKSVNRVLPGALAITFSYLRTVALPTDIFKKMKDSIIPSDKKVDVMVETVMKNDVYKKRVLDSLSDLLKAAELYY